MDLAREWHNNENEEFVSVEKIEDTYFIKTSPYPFRPDRGIYRSDRSRTSREDFAQADNRNVSKTDERSSAVTDPLGPKFTYFPDPGSRADLMNYKMSRKDKKHSETYYERIKRKQKELEASITTITTMSYCQKSSIEESKSTDAPSRAKNNSFKQNRLKLTANEKNKMLLQKLREKSRKKKQFAPKPPKKRTSEAFNGNLNENQEKTKTDDKKSCSKMDFLEDKNEIRKKSNKIAKKSKGARKQSGCDKTSVKRDYFSASNTIDRREDVSESSEEENARGEFKGIFSTSYRAENEVKEDEIVRGRISKFDQNIDERSKTDKNINKAAKLSQSRNESGDMKRNNLRDVNRDKFLNTTKQTDTFISSSFDNIRNVAKSSVSERLKSFERIQTTDDDGMKAWRGDTHLFKQTLVPVNKIRSHQRNEHVASKSETLNIAKHEKQTFKSFSSGHCNYDLSNISFLHTYYRKTRSFM